MHSSTFIVLAALAGCAVASGLGNWGGVIVGGPNSSPAAVAAARAAHLSEVARITNARLSALAAANARDGTPIAIAAAPVIAAPAPVIVQAAPQPIQDNADVALARANHLAELNRQTGAALSALAAAQSRAPVAIAAPAIATQIIGAPAIAISDAADVAAARAAHLAEVARITNSRLSALATANANSQILGIGAGKYY